MAKDYTQEYAIYYEETFVLVTLITSVHCLLAIVVVKHCTFLQIDVKNKLFLKQEVYVLPPPSYSYLFHKVYKLQ